MALIKISSINTIYYTTGYCQVYIINGKYKGLYVVGRIIFGEDLTELVIDDEQTVYDPLEK